MGKEVKIGLAVIGTLLVILCGVLTRRLIRDDTPPQVAGRHATGESAAAKSATATDDPADDDVADDSAGKPGYLARRNNWVRPAANHESAEADADDSGDAPRNSFLPRSDGDGQDEAVDQSDAAGIEDDPFQRRSLSSADTGDSDVQAAAAVEADDEPNDRRNSARLKGIEAVDDEPAEENPLRQPGRLNDDATEETSADADGLPFTPDPELQSSSAAAARDSAVRRSRFEPDEEGPADAPAARSIRKAPAKFEAAAPRRVDVEGGKYKVQPNDNYWTISEKVYGTGNYFKALHAHNRDQFPTADKLQVGQVIAAPPIAVLEQQYPELCPKQRNVPASHSVAVAAGARHQGGTQAYIVEEGDTLFDIARYQLGKASRWAEIYDLNKDALGEDFDFLQPGTELILPATDREEADTITRKRAPTDRR